LAKDCVINKPELVTDATVVNDVIRIVTDYSNNNRRLISKQIDSKGDLKSLSMMGKRRKETMNRK
jgi:hypothetical protein